MGGRFAKMASQRLYFGVLNARLCEISWPAYLFATYFFGATMTQALFLGIHEISHNLAFKTPKYNRWLAIFANLPIVFPYAAVFRPYHLDHHKFQGIDGIDTDIPCRHECSFVRGTASKIAWACCQILAYALRPCIVAPFEFNRAVELEGCDDARAQGVGKDLAAGPGDLRRSPANERALVAARDVGVNTIDSLELVVVQVVGAEDCCVGEDDGEVCKDGEPAVVLWRLERQ